VDLRERGGALLWGSVLSCGCNGEAGGQRAAQIRGRAAGRPRWRGDIVRVGIR
jgi:hypothetical protein